MNTYNGVMEEQARLSESLNNERGGGRGGEVELTRNRCP